MAASAIAYFKAVLPLTPFTLVLSNGQLIGGPEGANAIGRGPGQQLLAATVAAVEVDAAGTVASCAAIELEVGPLPGPGLCDDVKKAIFLPLPKEAEDRSARHAVEYVALIAMPPERAR